MFSKHGYFVELTVSGLHACRNLTDKVSKHTKLGTFYTKVRVMIYQKPLCSPK